MSKYASFSNEKKARLKLYQQQWREENPERTKQMKQAAITKGFQPTVYAYFDIEGNAVYIGKTNLPKRRFGDHRKHSFWWKPNLLLLTMTCKDEWEAMEYEGKWGGNLHPINNVDGQRKSKYHPYLIKEEVE